MAHTNYLFSDAELKATLVERLGEESYQTVVHPFEANEAMKVFARQATLLTQGTKNKCRKLVENILNKSQLNVRYSKYQTKTAIELFYEGTGNCLAYTNLFVALARSIGLRAFFGDASLLVSDVEEKEGVMVNSGHICAIVYAEPEIIFIDFANRQFKYMVGYSFINDIEAVAHYYNNLGYEKRLASSPEIAKNMNREGLAEFEMSVAVCPDFYRGYNNLGVVYQQLGEVDRAIECYRKAIDSNPEFSSVYGNLGMLFYQKDEIDQAAKYFRKAISYNQQNHFNYYYLGMIAMKKDDLKEARKNFQRAVRIKDDFAIAYYYLSLVYKRLGETEKAKEAREKAPKVPLPESQ